MKLREALHRTFRDETYFDWGHFAQTLTKWELAQIVFIGGVILYFLVRIVEAI
jgi:hypothetical protein